jgi:predicted Fe-Mo cluster-binding NifX family protein
MRIAVSIWQDSVSSVFDFAHKLLLVELQNGKEKNRQEVVLTERSGREKAMKLRELNVDVLICGAISRSMDNVLSCSKIEVLPFVTGRTEQVLNAYKTGLLHMQEYALPGCWQGARRHLQSRHDENNSDAKNNEYEKI